MHELSSLASLSFNNEAFETTMPSSHFGKGYGHHIWQVDIDITGGAN